MAITPEAPEPLAPHGLTHGQDIFNAPSTNRPTASLMEGSSSLSTSPAGGNGATSARANPTPNRESRSSREAHALANFSETRTQGQGNATRGLPTLSESAPAVTTPLARLGKATRGRYPTPNPRLSQ